MSYNRIIFLPADDSNMSQESVGSLLSKTFGRDQTAQIVTDASLAIVRWGAWSLRVRVERGPNVVQEAQAIARRFASDRQDKESLARCDKWLTISADEDYDMAHINHYIFLLEDLQQELPGAVMFVPEDGTFFNAGSFN